MIAFGLSLKTYDCEMIKILITYLETTNCKFSSKSNPKIKQPVFNCLKNGQI